MTIGERIKAARIQLGLSQVEFANKINVSKQTLYKYENNLIANIPADKIEAAATLCGISPAQLMGWEDWKDVLNPIFKEIKRVSDETMLYIKIFESHGYKIKLNPETVEVKTKSKKEYVFDRTDFMSMINRCYKDMDYNIERLIDDYTLKSSTLSSANTEPTKEEIQQDLDIMNDESNWD